MKRIIYSLVLMFAASGLFTACIDNVEPVGVQDMRNAHAEYLRACAKLKQADAQVQQAQVTYVEAQAALELAKADYQKALAEIAKAKNDADIAAQKAATDMAQARLELEKAKAALENAYLQAQIDAYSAKAAAELQAYIDSMNAVVAGLQNENERAAAELEIAKKQAELDSLAAVAELEYQVAKWQAELDSLATVQDVADAEATAKIDSINKAMEISAIQHEQALAQATEALRQTLAEIEVGKLTLTPDESASMELIVSSYNEALLWYEQAWNELQDYYQEAAQAAAFTETRMPVVLAKAERELKNLEKRTGKLYAEIELWTNIKNDVVDVMVAQLAAYQDTVQQWKDAVTNILAQKCFVMANEIPAIDAARDAAKKEAEDAYKAALKELQAPAKVKYNENNGSKKKDTKDEAKDEAKWLKGEAPAMKVGGPSEKEFIASYVTAPKKGEPQKEWSLVKSYDYPEWDAFDPIADFIYQANDFTPFVFTLFGMRLNVWTPAVDCSDDAKFEAAKKALFTQKASAHNPSLGLRTLIEDIEREYVNDFTVGANIKAARIASTAAYRDSIAALYDKVSEYMKTVDKTTYKALYDAWYNNPVDGPAKGIAFKKAYKEYVNNQKINSGELDYVYCTKKNHKGPESGISEDHKESKWKYYGYYCPSTSDSTKLINGVANLYKLAYDIDGTTDSLKYVEGIGGTVKNQQWDKVAIKDMEFSGFQLYVAGNEMPTYHFKMNSKYDNKGWSGSNDEGQQNFPHLYVDALEALRAATGMKYEDATVTTVDNLKHLYDKEYYTINPCFRTEEMDSWYTSGHDSDGYFDMVNGDKVYVKPWYDLLKASKSEEGKALFEFLENCFIWYGEVAHHDHEINFNLNTFDNYVDGTPLLIFKARQTELLISEDAYPGTWVSPTKFAGEYIYDASFEVYETSALMNVLGMLTGTLDENYGSSEEVDSWERTLVWKYIFARDLNNYYRYFETVKERWEQVKALVDQIEADFDALKDLYAAEVAAAQTAFEEATANYNASVATLGGYYADLVAYFTAKAQIENEYAQAYIDADEQHKADYEAAFADLDAQLYEAEMEQQYYENLASDLKHVYDGACYAIPDPMTFGMTPVKDITAAHDAINVHIEQCYQQIDLLNVAIASIKSSIAEFSDANYLEAYKATTEAHVAYLKANLEEAASWLEFCKGRYEAMKALYVE